MNNENKKLQPLMKKAKTNDFGLSFGITKIPDEVWYPILDNAIPNVVHQYWISNYGRVVSLANNKELFLALTPDNKGYLSFNLRLTVPPYKKYCRVHRIVMLVFRPILHPERYQVNHKDGVKTNNRISNLEWCTNEYNTIHAFENNLKDRLFSDEQAHLICKCLMMTMKYSDIAKELKIPYSKNIEQALSAILHGRNYVRISKQYDLKSVIKVYIERYKESSKKFSDEEIHTICKCLVKDMSNKEIANILGVDCTGDFIGNVRGIYKRKYHLDISNQYKFPEVRTALKTRQFVAEDERMFTDNQIEDICKLMKQGLSNKEIFEKLIEDGYILNCKKKKILDKISLIRIGKYRKDISSKYNLNRTKGLVACTEFKTRDVEKICRCIEFGLDNRDIIEQVLKAPFTQILSNRINNIRKGKSYTDISCKYKIEYVTPSSIDKPFTEHQVHSICKELEKGTNYREIIDILGLEFTESLRSRIGAIKLGKSYKEISSQYNISK